MTSFFVDVVDQWMILVLDDATHRHIEREAYAFSEALRAQMRDMLKRIHSDLVSGVAYKSGLRDPWMFDEDMAMEEAITEVLS